LYFHSGTCWLFDIVSILPTDKRPKKRNILAGVTLSYTYDSSSTISSSTLLPEAPDGGYGWIIVIASFLINFIGDGVSNSFGVIFPAIQDYFEASKTLSGIVASLFLSVPLLCGPFAGALTDIYDCRRMTIIGGFIAAAGSLLSFFASNIWIFSFTFAIVTAIGLSFCFNTAIVSVTFYFQIKESIIDWISGFKSLVIVPTFFTFLVSTFISSVFFDMPYVNFPEYAVKKHNASEAISSYLVSSIGITNMISTIACGLIADWKFIKPCVTTFYGIFVLLAGFCVAVAPFAQNYTQLLLLCSGFGVFISANHALSSVITVNLLCLYDFQTGFGILSLVEGIGSLIGPALVGMFKF
uniref:MFS domain-containing protein n=1 Tax=Dracunculus medinensis TaxID=318479 RepID=A0A0N4UEP8_DRAME